MRRNPGRHLGDQGRVPGCPAVTGFCGTCRSACGPRGRSPDGRSGRSAAASSRLSRSGGRPSTHRAQVARSTATLLPAHSATWAGGIPSFSLFSSGACSGCRTRAVRRATRKRAGAVRPYAPSAHTTAPYFLRTGDLLFQDESGGIPRRFRHPSGVAERGNDFRPRKGRKSATP
jgi:hypothetical protein